MKPQLSLEGIKFGVRSETKSAPVDSETPFRIAVLGDLSGRGQSSGEEGVADLARRRPIEVDRDNIDEVLARLDVRLDLAMPGQDDETLSLRFRELEDFDPDQLFEKLPPFARLGQLRRRLLNPSQFEQAAEEVRASSEFRMGAGRQEAVESAPAEPSTPAPPPEISGESLLEQSLAATEHVDAAPTPSRLSPPLEEAMRRAIEPIRVPKVGAEQQDLIACVDTMTGNTMRSVLQHPRFQALESAWQGLLFLVRRLSTDRQLKIFIIDVGKDELVADLRAADGLESSAFYKLIVDRTVGTFGGEPWAILAGNYTIEANGEDLLLAGCLADVGAGAGAPFIAAASPGLLGCESLAATPDPDDWQTELAADVSEIWERVRALPNAAYLGLILPRFLLRYPYGEASRPIDSFDFEELPDPGEHESYLWGNPAIAGAYLLGESFNRAGWRMRPGIVRDIEDMPLYAYELDKESMLKPPAETLMTDRAAERIAGAGLMPLASIKNSDAIRLVHWHSVAKPLADLAGRWS